MERIFTELTKLLCALEPERGLKALVSTGLLSLWLPEVCRMANYIDNCGNHTVWKHTIEVVRKVPANASIRWAAMLHDCGKCVITSTDSGILNSFAGYESVSIEIAKKILVRMRASTFLTCAVLSLIRHHNIDVGLNWDDPTCRRFLKQLAEDGLDIGHLALFVLADQSENSLCEAGSRFAYKYQRILIRLTMLSAKQLPLTTRELAVDGRILMEIARRQGGPWLGELQRYLLELVLDNPALNRVDILSDIAKEWLEAAPNL